MTEANRFQTVRLLDLRKACISTLFAPPCYDMPRMPAILRKKCQICAISLAAKICSYFLRRVYL